MALLMDQSPQINKLPCFKEKFSKNSPNSAIKPIIFLIDLIHYLFHLEILLDLFQRMLYPFLLERLFLRQVPPSLMILLLGRTRSEVYPPVLPFLRIVRSPRCWKRHLGGLILYFRFFISRIFPCPLMGVNLWVLLSLLVL